MKTKPYNRHETFLAALSDSSITVPTPLSREELYLAKIAGENVTIPNAPYNRYETYLAKVAGQDVTVPTPASRLEVFLYKACGYDVQEPTPANREEIFWKRYVGSEASGNSITIKDALAGSVRSINIQIQGEQLGNGLPSIINIRPITAYSSAIITISNEDGVAKYTHTVQFPTTYDVYRGSYDVASGALTVMEECVNLTGSEPGWLGVRMNTNHFIYRYIDSSIVIESYPRTCSHYVNADITTSNTDTGYYAYTSSNGAYIQFRPDNLPYTTTLDEWKAYLNAQHEGDTPLQATITFSEPISYALDPINIQLIAGTNVITCNCGTITLKYTPDL